MGVYNQHLALRNLRSILHTDKMNIKQDKCLYAVAEYHYRKQRGKVRGLVFSFLHLELNPPNMGIA